MGKYTVLRKLKGHLPPGRVYAAHNAETGAPAVLLAVKPGEGPPSAGWQLRVETGEEPRPFVAVEVLRAPECAHPARALAELADFATAALESVEALPEVQQHLEGGRAPGWRRLWRTQRRVRRPFLGGLAGAVLAGGAALVLSLGPVRSTLRHAHPDSTAPVQVAEEALSQPEALPVAGMIVRKKATVAIDMPRKPFRDQYQVDRDGKCKAKSETAIYGACWVLLGSLKPPCGDEAYEHKGGCYLPSMPSPRDPSSLAPGLPRPPAQQAQ